MLIDIKNDVFDIALRLREISSGYYVVYNTEKRAYEIHHSGQRGGSYCLTLPFDALDARAVDYVQKTRAENIKKIVAEMDRHNEIGHKEAVRRAADRCRL